MLRDILRRQYESLEEAFNTAKTCDDQTFLKCITRMSAFIRYNGQMYNIPEGKAPQTEQTRVSSGSHAVSHSYTRPETRASVCREKSVLVFRSVC